MRSISIFSLSLLALSSCRSPAEEPSRPDPPPAPIAPHPADAVPIDCPLRKAGMNPDHLKPFEDVEKYIAFLEREDRTAWQKPDEVIEALGLRGDEVIADVSVATDEATAALAAEQGYLPVAAICAQVPESLNGLEQKYLDTILLRLLDANSGETRNRLFLDEPEVTEAKLRVLETAGVDEDVLAGRLGAGLSDRDWAPERD